MAQTPIDDLRQQIDLIDNAILSLYKLRFDATDAVGAYKRDHNLPSVDPRREADQFTCINQLAQSIGLDKKFAHDLQRFVMDHAIANHQKLKAAAKMKDKQ